MKDMQQKISTYRKQNNWQGIVAALASQCVEGGSGWNEPTWLSELGFAYSQLGELDRALAIYQRWITVEPDKAAAFYCLGYVYYLKEDWDNAIRWFDEALRIFPDYLVCLYRKGQALFRFNKPRKAIEPLSKAVEVYDAIRNEDFKKRQRRNAMKSLFTLARAYHQIDEHQQALALLQRLFNEDVNGVVEREHKHYALGKVLTGLKRYDDALSELHKAKHPRQPRAYVLDQIGRVKHLKGDYRGALAAYDQALRLRRQGYILYNRALTHLAMENTAAAQKDLHDALKIDRLGKHKIYLELGRISLNSGHFTEAESYLQEAIRFKRRKYESDFAEAHYLLVFVYLKSNRKDDAQTEFYTALQLNPDLQWDDSLRSLLNVPGDTVWF